MTSTWAAMSRALRHRNYRLFFAGQGVSLIGSWVTKVAMSWLVFRLTGSAWMLGIVGFAGQIPTFLLAPLGGVLVDRIDRHRIIVVTQALSMLQSALLAYFTLRGTIDVPIILGLSIFQGLIVAFEIPARQAFVVEMVNDRADLANAIALNSTMVNSARLLGPASAAILVGLVGEGLCFTIDAVSYLAVLASLLLMRLTPRTTPRASGRVLADLAVGFRYVRDSRPIRRILLLVALVSLTGVPYTVLMPVFAARVHGGGANTLGILMASTGLGAVLGALWLASRRSVVGLGRVIVKAGVAFAVGLMAFSHSPWLPLSMLTLAVVGSGMMVLMAAANTMLQTIVDEDKRGRVMSFYAMSFFGMLPFGSLMAGSLGASIGAPMTVLVGGVVTLGAVGLFWRGLPHLRRDVRPIYERLGIIPVTVAEGLNQAAVITGNETAD
jgi:MFS family permease